MAISEAYSGTWTSSTTETTLNTATPETTDGIYQVFIDVDALSVGKAIQIKIKEKAISAGTQRTCLNAVVAHDPSSDDNLWVSPSLLLLHGWDVTLQELDASSSLSVPWSIRKVA